MSTDKVLDPAVEILDRITDGFVVLDTDWTISYLNAAVERMIGRRRDELLGKVIWEEYPDTVGTVFEESYRRAAAEQVKVEFEALYEPLGIWAQVHVYPSPSGLSIYVQDITTRKETELALAASEARYRLIAETAYEGIWLVDTEFRTTWCNRRLAEILGYPSPEAMLGVAVMEVVAEEDRPELRRQMAERRQGISAQYDIRLRRADGRVIWALVRISPIFAADGTFAGALGMISDISDRKHFEQELLAQREWFKVTLSSIGDAVIATDAEGRVTFMNTVAEELTAWPEAEALGRPLTDVFHIVNEQTREPVEDPVTKVLRENRIVGLANHTALVARDGLERPIDDSGAPIRDADGRILGVVLVFRDNTDKARAEAALRASEQRFRSLCACSPVGIFISDGQGRTTYMNASCQEITGVSPGGSPGGDWLDAVHPEDRKRVARAWAEERRLEGDVRFVHPSGEVRWARVGSAPIVTEEGLSLGHVGTLEDVTDRRLAEEALREADRRKDEFLAMLGHELRNPLAPVRSAIEVMRLRPDDPAVLQRAREIVERQVQHMARLVDDLLDVSRITRGKIDLQRERVELGSVFERAVETIRPLIAGRGQQLALELPAEPIHLDADPVRLAQVIGNLLHNASKYTPRGGRIALAAALDGGAAVVRVADTGAGIRPEALSRIFEPFTQLDAPLDPGQGGLGIGLTLVKALVELHGGRVRAHSDGPGRGSEFTLHLPVAGAEQPAASIRPAGERQAPGLRSILIVDDNADAAETLALLLAAKGFEARVALDAEVALEQIRRERPELVLLDIGLPKMDGYELAGRLRRDPDLAGLRLIALTGYGQEEDQRRALEAGFDLHLVKPVELDTLTSAFAHLFSAEPRL